MKKDFKKMIICCLTLILIFHFSNIYAIEDQFEINLSVTSGADTTAPSVPTGLSATAVSSSQIDLSWTASTDNVAVTQYNVYRDNSLITSVSGTTHSDTGLNASTTYAYVVSALDAASNQSARSATSSATTLSLSSGGGGSGGYVSPQIFNIAVIPDKNNAVITWNTTQPTLGTLSWGFTEDFEIGAVSETIFGLNHSATIYGLLPGTMYFFSITATNGRGLLATSQIQSFNTLSLPYSVTNPTNFIATPQDDSILLEWENPMDSSFSEVRLVRNKNFFPSDENDGEVLYEGVGENFIDSDVDIGAIYYYAIFSKDSDGNYSSGVLTRSRIPLEGEGPILPGDVFDELPKAPSIHPLIEELSIFDFDFIQDGRKINILSELSGNTLPINGSQNLTILLDYQKVPEILKSILITLKHPQDPQKTFSFLLRVNSDKTAYTATIGALGESGKYNLDISIVDYKNRGLKKIVGSIFATVILAIRGNDSSPFGIYGFVDKNFLSIISFILVLMIILLSKIIFDRRKMGSGQINSHA